MLPDWGYLAIAAVIVLVAGLHYVLKVREDLAQVLADHEAGEVRRG